MNHDDDCAPVFDPILLDPNDWYYQNAIRFCPYCLITSWHIHPCHHENDTSSASA